MEESKGLRSQRKGVLTRHIRTLNKYIIEEDLESVRSRLNQMRPVIADIEKFHDFYMESLAAVPDISEEALREGEVWLDKVLTEYGDQVKRAKQWVKTQEAEFKAKTEVALVTGATDGGARIKGGADVTTVLGLPKMEIP